MTGRSYFLPDRHAVSVDETTAGRRSQPTIWTAAPAVLILVPVVFSVIAWLLPVRNTALNGFDARADVTPTVIAVLLLWYTACCICGVVGAAIGRSLRTGLDVDDVLLREGPERQMYFIVSACGVIGVTWAVILAQGSTSIADSLASGLGNSLKESLDGQAGVATLRYATAIAVPMAFYRLLTGRGSWWSATVNVAALLVNVAFSSRLSFVLAIFAFAFLVQTSGRFRIRLRYVLPGAGVTYLALALANYSRNGRYYAEAGVSNIFIANWYQIQTYLASPWQVSVGVADGLAGGDLAGSRFGYTPVEQLVPTFFQIKTLFNSFTGPLRYGYRVDISDLLTTNSVFGDTVAQFGILGLGTTLVGILFGGLFYGIASSWRSIARVAAGAIGYAFAEVWRVYLFNQGIILFMVILVFAVLAVVGHRSRVASRWPGD